MLLLQIPTMLALLWPLASLCRHLKEASVKLEVNSTAFDAASCERLMCLSFVGAAIAKLSDLDL